MRTTPNNTRGWSRAEDGERSHRNQSARGQKPEDKSNNRKGAKIAKKIYNLELAVYDSNKGPFSALGVLSEAGG